MTWKYFNVNGHSSFILTLHFKSLIHGTNIECTYSLIKSFKETMYISLKTVIKLN